MKLQVDFPKNGQVINFAPVVVMGTTEPRASVSVNGYSTVADGNGNFILNGDITQAGPNTLTITTTLNANSVTQQVSVIFKDYQLPDEIMGDMLECLEHEPDMNQTTTLSIGHDVATVRNVLNQIDAIAKLSAFRFSGAEAAKIPFEEYAKLRNLVDPELTAFKQWLIGRNEPMEKEVQGWDFHLNEFRTNPNAPE